MPKNYLEKTYRFFAMFVFKVGNFMDKYQVQG